jgi:hypothetical protein
LKKTISEQEVEYLHRQGCKANEEDSTIDQALFPFSMRDDDVIGSECDDPASPALVLTLDKAMA